MKLYTIIGGYQAASSITTPIVMNLENLRSIDVGVALSGNTCQQLTFNMTTGSAYVNLCANPALVLSEINAFTNAAGSGALQSQDYGTYPVLISVNPTLIKNSSGGTITIKGANFALASLGTVWIEDVGGGMDSNGTSFTMSFVDSNTITGVWASAGDGGTPAGVPVMLYYKDTSGNLSNILWVTLF